MTAVEQVPVDARNLLVAQVREAYARAAYTHKTHEKQADRCYQQNRRQQKVLIALTVVSSGTFLASLAGIFLDQAGTALVTSFIALLMSGINLGTKTFKYGEDTQKHRDVAAKVWNLRESYLSLIVDLQSESISVDEGRAQRDKLQGKALEIYGEAPRTTPKAYALAQEALQLKEDLTFSPEEIDHLLPAEFRTTPKKGDDSGGQ